MKLVVKSYPINKKDDRKKSFYELSDNLLRFYYSFIFPVKSRLMMLNPNAFYKSFIENGLDTFIFKRFEGIVNYRHPKGYRLIGFVENCFQHC